MRGPAHTPGPWEVGSNGGYGALDGVQISERRGYVLAVAIGDVPELHAAANARLIAAAPELLAALKALDSYLDAIVCYASAMDEHEPNRLAFNARAAVAKAEAV